ncbi:MAG TPA: dihydrofolate reductase family protein [Polyangiaceae bacterium]|nr:dihydrofolate reductase family protein [Polyangiaceae bacterium]
MRKLIESTLVTIGGDIGAPEIWAQPFIDDEFTSYTSGLVTEADALLLGRVTYEHFARSYPAMAGDANTAVPKALLRATPAKFIERMNHMPKYVASKTLKPKSMTWNASLLEGDVAGAVAALKRESGGALLKFGTGSFDRALLEHRLIDEFHFLVHPVGTGKVQPLFAGVVEKVDLALRDVHRFKSGVVVLVYEPKS